MPEYVTFRQIDSEGVLVDLKQGVYYGLNELGSKIVRMSSDERTLQHIVSELAAEYNDIDEAQLRSDVESFIDQLAGKGLLTVHETSSS